MSRATKKYKCVGEVKPRPRRCDTLKSRLIKILMILFSEKKAFYDDLKQTYMANGYWNTFFQKLRFDEIGPKLLGSACSVEKWKR